MGAVVREGQRVGFTFVARLLHLGAASGVAYVLGLTPGTVACAGRAIAARRAHDGVAMILCVAAILLSTSVVWLHYFVLLIVPLALTRPRLSPAWALPMLMWVCLPTDLPQTWQIMVALGTTLGVVAATLGEPVVRHRRITVPTVTRLAYRL